MEKVLPLKNKLRVRSRYGVGLKTRIRALKCYQPISILHGVYERLTRRPGAL